MKNNELGISAIKLIFTMIIIIAVIVGGIILVKKFLNENTKKDIETDLLYIQAKCKVIYDKHIINEEEQLIGEKIEEYIENEEINNILKETDKEWYKLNQDDLDRIGAGYLKEENGYIINYDTDEIIYAAGIEKNDHIFYKLSDILNEEENTIEQEETNANYEIVDENNEEADTSVLE